MSHSAESRGNFSGALSAAEARRYGRHLSLPEIGIEGQLKMRAARVLIVGAGGLGSPIALYLAAAGVGKLVLVDFDRVEESNLQRQILYGQRDLGRLKVEVAAERLRQTNPLIEIEARAERFAADNARRLLDEVDLVLDGTDNFPTRYLVNDACVLYGKPFVYGSIYRFEGQAALFAAPAGPCYRCLFPEPPPDGLIPNCAEGGVLGALPGIVGSIQANEAIKWLTGAGESLRGRLLMIDSLSMRVREVRVPRSADCPVCSERATITELREEASVCLPEPEAGRGDVEAEFPMEMTARELRDRLDRASRTGSPIQLLDVREPFEWDLARIANATLIPLGELDDRRGELDPSAPTVVLCHHGGRSAAAVRYLRARGFDRIANLTGGIESWSRTVDPGVPRY
jgi:molybdopterin/thiamine biosynthesis adenylyltransferase/rhodanese-related sulfurtransferase